VNIRVNPWLIIGYNFLYKSKLYKKIYGWEAAAAIANSMGDVTEGMAYQRIDEK
jgi:hypothetical protein